MSYNTHGLSSPLAELVEENRRALSQLHRFVGDLSPEHFRQAFGELGHHTLGKHVRHIIDHYEALWCGYEAGEAIDYEQRRRDEALEQWPQLAARRLAAIDDVLATLVDRQPPERFELAYPVGDDLPRLATSLMRELAFLTSHTIHHMAIIGLLAESLGIQLSPTFGVHPSTLRHWQRGTPVTADPRWPEQGGVVPTSLARGPVDDGVRLCQPSRR